MSGTSSTHPTPEAAPLTPEQSKAVKPESYQIGVTTVEAWDCLSVKSTESAGFEAPPGCQIVPNQIGVTTAVLAAKKEQPK